MALTCLLLEAQREYSLMFLIMFSLHTQCIRTFSMQTVQTLYTDPGAPESTLYFRAETLLSKVGISIQNMSLGLKSIWLQILQACSQEW